MKMIFILLLWPVLAQAMPTEPVAPINTQYDATNGMIARLESFALRQHCAFWAG